MVKNKSKVIILLIAVIISLTLILGFVNFAININRRSQAKQSLFSAIEKNDMLTIKQILEEYPSLINTKERLSDLFSIITDRSNSTPLLEAIRFSNADLIKYFIEKGADVNISNGTKVAYPIIEVLGTGLDEKYEIVWLMIKNGANLSVEQQFYTVPYAVVCCPIEDDEVEFQQQSLDLIKYMVEQEVSLKAPDPTNSQTGNTERCTNYDINSLIGLASRNNYILVVQYLLDNQIYSIDDSVSLDGTTALIQAVKGNAYGTCELLIGYGADKNKVDNNGKTAYDYAVEIGNQEIINLLS